MNRRVFLRAAAVGLAVGAVGCAPIAPRTPTVAMPRTPATGETDRAIAAVEAEARLRLALPTDLPADAYVARVAMVNDKPPTVDVEYFVGGERVLLRQRPAQSNPQFPDRAKPIDLGGLQAQGVARVDDQGRPAGVEIYWTRGASDFMLAGNLSADEMARIARSVSPPGAV